MNKTIGLLLVVYSLLPGGLSSLAYHLAPEAARTVLIVGLAGGVLCLLWGVGSRHSKGFSEPETEMERA